MTDDADRQTTMHVQRAVQGDPDSVTWIVSHFSPALLAQAHYRMGGLPRSIYDPEDLVHDTWMTTLPRLPALPPRDGRYTPVLMRFLSTTLLNRCNTLVQKHLCRKPVRVEETVHDSAGTVDLLQVLPAQATGVVSGALRSEVADRIRTGIEELSPEDREVIVLRGIEQNANKTVAMLLRIPPNTVAVRYKRALERLRGKLPRSVFDELD